jgi:uncharacterized membrane protein YdfJ with MMPL/SSD domain
MFELIGRLVIRFRFLVVAAWVVLAAVAFALAPSLADVGTADETSFLPADSPSVRAREALQRAFPDEQSSGVATIVLSRDGGLTDADRAYAGELAAWLVDPGAPPEIADTVSTVLSAVAQPELASLLQSTDGVVELLQVRMSIASFQEASNSAVEAMRDQIALTAPGGLDVRVTGTAGIAHDYLASVVEGTDRTTIATIVLVLVILLLIYRAPIAAMVPLITIGAAFLVARGVLGWLAEAGWEVPSLVDSIVVVLVFGVGTDYTIFLISRFREELARAGWRDAGAQTVGRIGAVIAASAATVIVGLGSMAVGEFGMVQRMGPSLALAIAITLVAGLTLTPALLAIAGDWLFWPRHLHLAQQRAAVDGPAGAAERLNPQAAAVAVEPPPGTVAPDVDATAQPPETGFWARLASVITDRPGLVTVSVLIVLAIPLLGLSGLRSNFDVIAELPGDSEARLGYETVAAHLDRGQLLPVTVLLELDGTVDPGAPAGLALIGDMTDRLAAIEGVAAVRSLVSPTGDGSVPAELRPSAQLAAMALNLTGGGAADPQAALAALVKAEQSGTLEAMTAYLRILARDHPDGVAADAWASMEADLAAIRATIARIAADPTGTTVLEDAASLQALLPALAVKLDGASATMAARPDDLYLPVSAPGASGEAARGALGAYASQDGKYVRFYLVTEEEPYAAGAFDAVRRVEDGLAGPVVGAGAAYVAGPTSEMADVQSTIASDFTRVAVITLIGVFIVLVLLLRSLVAPIYLVGTVLLSYLTTLGLASWIFQDALGLAAVNYFIPLIVFVLLVALGSDYNIFLMSRVREESETREIRAGIRFASARTGAVITSAGVILAGTFASLVTSPLAIMIQVGVVVALGVLIDTFLVRSLLVPAITTLVGDRAWWPLGRHRAAPGGTASRVPAGMSP